ncbi:MAG: DUF6316 family protein [Pseudomonadales bacterium]
MSSRSLQRLEGRLFAEGGCLFMVLNTDESAGTARVSCRLNGEPQVIDMPLSEVTRRISSSAALVLDNLNGPESKKRVTKQRNGWSFSTREGIMGPYETEAEAVRELGRYILCMQTTGTPRKESQPAAPSEQSRPAPRRRVSDLGRGAQAAA